MPQRGPDGDGDSTSQPTARHQVRRSHKKSRHGCCYCKRRRIKVSYTRATCHSFRSPARDSSCHNFKSPGDLSADIIDPRPSGRPRRELPIVPLEGDYHDEHHDIASTASSATLTPSTVLPAPSPELPLEAPLHLPWDVEDLELFYHYLTAVAPVEHDSLLWRHQLPRLAFRRHSLLHILLSIAAVHLARSQPSRSVELLSRADSHMGIGLRQATQALGGLNEHNCAELYLATILICTYTFARKPGPRHLLTIGLTKIFETLENGAAGDVPAPLPTSTSPQCEQAFIICETIEWETAFANLSLLVNEAPGKGKSVCQRSLGMLRWCFEDTFGASTNPKPAADAKFQVIMAWLYVLEDDFVNMLKEKEAVALVLLAHFAVLLQTLDSVWFLEGWGLHMLQGISEIMGESPESRWLRWPMLQIQRAIRFAEAVQCARSMRREGRLKMADL
ncbi:hypothetical protein F4779DRAFT_638296 [Xylariaceae sp. FL0662B]|nr:hypothetical protein F4779DRAFT_638296 [Xylariaceae sp. FL0662B]